MRHDNGAFRNAIDVNHVDGCSCKDILIDGRVLCRLQIHSRVLTTCASRISTSITLANNSCRAEHHPHSRDVDEPSLNHDGPSKPHAKLAPSLERLDASRRRRRASLNRHRSASKPHTCYAHINFFRPTRSPHHPRSRGRPRYYIRHAQRHQIFHQEHGK